MLASRVHWRSLREKPENCACSHILLGPVVISKEGPGWRVP